MKPEISQSIGFLAEADFVPVEQYRVLGIPPESIPPDFKVWKHSFPPLDNYLNTQGGNAYGISVVEMAVKGLDKSALELLNSNDYRKINRFYRDRGIYKVLSKYQREFYLVPESVEAIIRFGISDKLERISRVIHTLVRSHAHKLFRVGAIIGEERLLYNRLKSKNPGVSFERIDLWKKGESGRFDLIYLASEPNELVSAVTAGLTRPSTVSEPVLFNYIPLKIYDLLAPGGELLLLGPNQISSPQAKIELPLDRDLVWFKGLFFYLSLFQIDYHLTETKLTITSQDLLNFCNFPEAELAELKTKLHKDLADASFDEILKIREDAPKQKPLFRYAENHYLSALFFEEEACSYTPSYLLNHYRVSLPFDPFRQTLYKKRKTTASRKIIKSLSQERLLFSSLELVAGYKNTFYYLLEVLRIVRMILDFDLDRTEFQMKSVSDFPFEVEGSRAPVEQMMKLKNLLNDKNSFFFPLFNLVRKYEQLESISEVFRLGGSRVNVIDNLNKLLLLGFSREEIREIILIVSGHGPMTRIVYGKYPIKSLGMLTNKVHERGQTYTKVKYLMENFTFCSIAEALAINDRSFNVSQWKHFFSLLRSSKMVIGDTAKELDWNLIQKNEIDASKGTINMTCLMLMRIWGYFFPLETIIALKGKPDEELLMEANYSEEKADQLKEIKGLLELMERFDKRNYSDNDFSKPYMFRNILECELHGTGRILPLLGMNRGFKLLWLSVFSSLTYKFNFNYLPLDDSDVEKLKADLDRLDESMLSLDYLGGIKEELEREKIAYLYDTGVQLVWDDQVGSLNIGYVNLNKSVSRLNCLLKSVEELRVSQVSPEVLKEIERLFFSIEKYPSVFHREINRLKKEGGEPGRITALKKRLTMVNNLKERVRERFLRELFNPAEVYTGLSLLYRNCSSLLNFLLKEFGKYAQVAPKRVEHSRTVIDYILRCVEKFQALAVDDRDLFSNPLSFNELALREFGDARSALKIHPKQFSYLRKIYLSIPEDIRQALSLALIFQDIGKIPEYRKKYGQTVDCTDHAEAGAKMLEISGAMQKLTGDLRVSSIVISLIRHHGLLGQVIRGESTPEQLQEILASPELLDVYFLHSVIAAGAVRSDFLTYDRVVNFIRLYAELRRNIKGKRIWNYQRSLNNKAGSMGMDLSENIEEESRRALVMERVFKLSGSPYIYYYEALQKWRNPRMTGLFFYNRTRDIKSIGSQTYLSQLDRAVFILKEYERIPGSTARFLMESLYLPDNNFRLFSAESALSKLDAGFLWKFLTLCFRCARVNGERATRIDFMPIADLMDSRYELVRNELSGYTYKQLSAVDCPKAFSASRKKGIVFRINRKYKVLQVGFRDYINEQKIISYLEGIVNINALDQAYERIKRSSRISRYLFEDQMERISQGYHCRLEAVKMLAVERVQERMLHITHNVVNYPRAFSKLKHSFERACMAKFFDDRLIHLLTDKYEYCLGELRNQFISKVIERINCSHDLPELERQYREIRNFFKTHQSFFRKELQQYVLFQYLKKKSSFRVEGDL